MDESLDLKYAFFNNVPEAETGKKEFDDYLGNLIIEFEEEDTREKWYEDPRIDAYEVSEDDLYNNHPEMKQFQRGHLVKRTDPSWGTKVRAIKGQADTFHFTNCVPQHFKFNPIVSRWAGIENWITDTSDNENIRVSVFCGPIFNENDYKIEYLQIPEQFWKIVIWTEEGELKATGMIADQGMLIAKRSEDLPSGVLQEYQCTIEHIEVMTGFNFGGLSNFDTYPKSEFTVKMRKIKSFNDMSLSGTQQWVKTKKR